MKSRKALALILILILLIVLTIPTISAQNKPLTQKEINKFGKNEFGLLSYDHFYDVFKYERNLNDEYKTFKGEITVYNTYNRTLNIIISKTLFSEERVHDTIRKNYTYYQLPNINWVTIPKSIKVQPNQKYTFEYSVKMPVEEAFELSKGGGYIFLIIPYVDDATVQTAPGYKVFITLLDEDKKSDINGGSPVTDEEINIPLLFNIIILAFSSIILLISFKNRKKIKRSIIYEKY